MYVLFFASLLLFNVDVEIKMVRINIDLEMNYKILNIYWKKCMYMPVYAALQREKKMEKRKRRGN